MAAEWLSGVIREPTFEKSTLSLLGEPFARCRPQAGEERAGASSKPQNEWWVGA